MIAQKIAYNVLFVGVAKVISIGMALFAMGMLSRHLGTGGFGQYILALSFLSFFMALADMGLHAIATREISREGAPEEEIINKIFTLRLVITAAIFVLALLLIGFLPYPAEIKSAIFVIAGAFLFSSSYNLLNGVFQKHIAMDRVAIAELCGKCVQMGIILALVLMDLPFIVSVLAIFAAMVTNFVLIIIFVRKYIRVKLDWDPQYWKEFLKKSYPLGISAVATFLYFKANTFILSGYHPFEDVGIYGAATKIIETIIFFPAMVIGLVLPLLSRYIFTEQKTFDKTVAATIKFFMLILIPLVGGIFFLADEAISIINGPGFEAAVPVLQISAFSLIGIFFGHLFSSTAIAANLQRTLTILLLVTAAFNIGINYILIPQFSYYGAAVSSVITEFFVMAVVLALIVQKTTFRFIVKKPYIYMIAICGMIAINLFLTFNAFAVFFISLLAYALFMYITGVITAEDLKNIRPQTKSV